MVLWSLHVLYTDELCEGDKVLLSWAPNRRCELRYLGENKFVVESVLNSKLMVGDTFVCAQFFQKNAHRFSTHERGKNDGQLMPWENRVV